jgi:hypothetical protein
VAGLGGARHVAEVRDLGEVAKLMHLHLAVFSPFVEIGVAYGDG